METITHYAKSKFILHAFVIMPDHLHMLITPHETLEKCTQPIKGGFSFRARKDLDWQGEVWQNGFTDHRIRNEEDWKQHIEYIKQNPVRVRLAENSILYAYQGFPDPDFPQGLKPLSETAADVRAEARTLHRGTESLVTETALPEEARLAPRDQ